MWPKNICLRKQPNQKRRKKIPFSNFHAFQLSKKEKKLSFSTRALKFGQKYRSLKAKQVWRKRLHQGTRKYQVKYSSQHIFGYNFEEKVIHYLKEIDHAYLLMAITLIAFVLIRHRTRLFLMQPDFSALFLSLLMPTIMMGIVCRYSLLVLFLENYNTILSNLRLYALCSRQRTKNFGKNVTCQQEYLQLYNNTTLTEHSTATRWPPTSELQKHSSDGRHSRLFLHTFGIWKLRKDIKQQINPQNKINDIENGGRINLPVYLKKRMKIPTDIPSISNEEYLRRMLKLYFKTHSSCSYKGLQFLNSIVAPYNNLPSDYSKRMAQMPPPDKAEMLQYDYGRRATFDHYEGRGCEANLARDGFYHDVHSANRCMTRCFRCSLENDSWDYFSAVNDYHRLNSPRCPHLAELDRTRNASRLVQTEGNFHSNNHAATQAQSMPLVTASGGEGLQLSIALTTRGGFIHEVSSSYVNSSAETISRFSGVTSLITERIISTASGTQVTESGHTVQPNSLVSGIQLSATRGAIPKVPASNTYPTGQISTRNLIATSSEEAFQNISSTSLMYSRGYANLISTNVSGRSVHVNNDVRNDLFPTAAGGAVSRTSSQQLVQGMRQTQLVSHRQQPFTQTETAEGRTGQMGSYRSSQVAKTQTSESFYLNNHEVSRTMTSQVTVTTSTMTRATASMGYMGQTEASDITRPSHPEYVVCENRRRTFNTWPHRNPSPGGLAEAGLFYTGESDLCRCFYCDTGLHQWNEGEDPWLEHGIANSECQFLLQNKDAAFFQKASQRREERDNGQVSCLSNSIISVPVEDIDPMAIKAAIVLKNLGYDPDLIRRAIQAVWRETGSFVDDSKLVLEWILKYSEVQSSLATGNYTSLSHPIGDSIVTVTTTVAMRVNNESRVIGRWSGSHGQREETGVKSLQNNTMIGQHSMLPPFSLENSQSSSNMASGSDVYPIPKGTNMSRPQLLVPYPTLPNMAVSYVPTHSNSVEPIDYPQLNVQVSETASERPYTPDSLSITQAASYARNGSSLATNRSVNQSRTSAEHSMNISPPGLTMSSCTDASVNTTATTSSGIATCRLQNTQAITKARSCPNLSIVTSMSTPVANNEMSLRSTAVQPPSSYTRSEDPLSLRVPAHSQTLGQTSLIQVSASLSTCVSTTLVNKACLVTPACAFDSNVTMPLLTGSTTSISTLKTEDTEAILVRQQTTTSSQGNAVVTEIPSVPASSLASISTEPSMRNEPSPTPISNTPVVEIGPVTTVGGFSLALIPTSNTALTDASSTAMSCSAAVSCVTTSDRDIKRDNLEEGVKGTTGRQQQGVDVTFEGAIEGQQHGLDGTFEGAIGGQQHGLDGTFEGAIGGQQHGLDGTFEGAIGGQQHGLDRTFEASSTQHVVSEGKKKRKKKKKGSAARKWNEDNPGNGINLENSAQSYQQSLDLPGISMEQFQNLSTALQQSPEKQDPKLREDFTKFILGVGEVTKSMSKDMEKLKAEKVTHDCRVCMDESIAVIFLPCGHLVCCEGCARKQKMCPICREPIKEIKRVFQS